MMVFLQSGRGTKWIHGYSQSLRKLNHLRETTENMLNILKKLKSSYMKLSGIIWNYNEFYGMSL